MKVHSGPSGGREGRTSPDPSSKVPPRPASGHHGQGAADKSGAFMQFTDYSKLNSARHVATKSDTFNTPSHLHKRDDTSPPRFEKRFGFGDAKDLSDICEDGFAKTMRRLSQDILKDVRVELHETIMALKMEMMRNCAEVSSTQESNFNSTVAQILTETSSVKQECSALSGHFSEALSLVREDIKQIDMRVGGDCELLQGLQGQLKESVSVVREDVGGVRQRQERGESSIVLQLREMRSAQAQLSADMQEVLRRSQNQVAQVLTLSTQTVKDLQKMQHDFSRHSTDMFPNLDVALSKHFLKLTATLDLRQVCQLISHSHKAAHTDFNHLVAEVGKIQQALNVDFAQVLDGLGEMTRREEEDRRGSAAAGASRRGSAKEGELDPAKGSGADQSWPLGSSMNPMMIHPRAKTVVSAQPRKRLREFWAQTDDMKMTDACQQTDIEMSKRATKFRFGNKKKVLPAHSVSSVGSRGTVAEHGGGVKKAVFADAEAMKQKVRQALVKPQYNVFERYHATGYAQRIAKSWPFDYLTFGMILANTVWIGVDTDYNNSAIIATAHPVFFIAENVFCSYFTFELFVRFMAFRSKHYCLRDRWFVFDAFLLAIMVLETWVVTIVLIGLGQTQRFTTKMGGTIKIVRLVRMCRISRMARLLHAVPELLIVVKGVLAASRAVGVFFMMWLVIIYLFAVVFRQLTVDTSIGDRYFETVPEAMNTLLLDGVLPGNANLVHNMSAASPLLWPLIMIFVLLASLTLMFMLIGVLVDVICSVAATEKESVAVLSLAGELREAMRNLERDEAQPLMKADFQNLLIEAEIITILHDVGVDVVVLMDMTDMIYDEHAVGGLSFEQFIDVVLNMRGTNPATVKDIKQQQRLTKVVVTNAMEKMHGKLEDEFGRLRVEMQDIKARVQHDSSDEEEESQRMMSTHSSARAFSS